MKTFSKDEPRTVLDIWYPRYSSQYTDIGEKVALLAKYKVDAAAPWVIVEFTQAKHLLGQRYCVRRRDAQACRIDSNGTIPCYAVPMSKLEPYDLASEVKDTVEELGW